MWVVMFAAIIMANGHLTPLQVEGSRRFPDEATCLEYLSLAEPRMPDYVRGHLGTAFDVEVYVKGACVVKGDPA